MKNFILFIITAVLITSAGVNLTRGEDYGLSSDPRLAKARESFFKAEGYMEKAHKEFRRRPGLAKKQFEHAEDYYAKARFIYQEEGHKYGIDVSHEVAVCSKKDREAHVWVGKARGKSVKKSGF